MWYFIFNTKRRARQTQSHANLPDPHSDSLNAHSTSDIPGGDWSDIVLLSYLLPLEQRLASSNGLKQTILHNCYIGPEPSKRCFTLGDCSLPTAIFCSPTFNDRDIWLARNYSPQCITVW